MRRRSTVLSPVSFARQIEGVVESSLPAGDVDRILAPLESSAIYAHISRDTFRPQTINGRLLRVEFVAGDARVCYGETTGKNFYQLSRISVVNRKPLYLARPVGGAWRVVYGTQEYKAFYDIAEMSIANGVPLYAGYHRDHGTWFPMLGTEAVYPGCKRIANLRYEKQAILFDAVRHAAAYRVTVPIPKGGLT